MMRRRMLTGIFLRLRVERRYAERCLRSLSEKKAERLEKKKCVDYLQ